MVLTSMLMVERSVAISLRQKLSTDRLNWESVEIQTHTVMLAMEELFMIQVQVNGCGRKTNESAR